MPTATDKLNSAKTKLAAPKKKARLEKLRKYLEALQSGR